MVGPTFWWSQPFSYLSISSSLEQDMEKSATPTLERGGSFLRSCQPAASKQTLLHSKRRGRKQISIRNAVLLACHNPARDTPRAKPPMKVFPGLLRTLTFRNTSKIFIFFARSPTASTFFHFFWVSSDNCVELFLKLNFISEFFISHFFVFSSYFLTSWFRFSMGKIFPHR